jgi:hypothetical protein
MIGKILIFFLNKEFHGILTELHGISGLNLCFVGPPAPLKGGYTKSPL